MEGEWFRLMFDLEKECDWIRNYPVANSSITLQYSLNTDLTKLGGNKHRVCKFERTFGPDRDPNEVADTFYSLVIKARENIKQLSEEHGFTEVLSVG